eukprot:TRINITY_DN6039_c0_g1_i1.p1 TRINITY_DN6039_c0_g1~~TRINITY_DN6039_c0_g1_i1.p1  ORF type:complete len:285 (+),score=61.37 TRINITY_DN6039_c0_g1_i1:40-894(+)
MLVPSLTVFSFVRVGASRRTNGFYRKMQKYEYSSSLEEGTLTKERANQVVVDHLKSRGLIRKSRVEDAMMRVKHANFVMPKKKRKILKNLQRDKLSVNGITNFKPFETIRKAHDPSVYALCLENLEDTLKDGARVLDLGFDSGYLSACFAHMVGENGVVIRIESSSEGVNSITKNIMKDNPELLQRILILEVPDYIHSLLHQTPLAIEELGDMEESFDIIYAERVAGKLLKSLEKSLKYEGKILKYNGKIFRLKQKFQLDQEPAEIHAYNMSINHYGYNHNEMN